VVVGAIDGVNVAPVATAEPPNWVVYQDKIPGKTPVVVAVSVTDEPEHIVWLEAVML
jgi:hypothetical protein